MLALVLAVAPVLAKVSVRCCSFNLSFSGLGLQLVCRQWQGLDAFLEVAGLLQFGFSALWAFKKNLKLFSDSFLPTFLEEFRKMAVIPTWFTEYGCKNPQIKAKSPHYKLRAQYFKTFKPRSELSGFWNSFFCGPRSNRSCWFSKNFQMVSFWSRYHKIRITESRFAVFGSVYLLVKMMQHFINIVKCVIQFA